MGICFSENKKICALVEKKEGREKVGLYYGSNEWTQLQRISLDTFDLQDIRLLAGDTQILVWDSPLEPTILIYNIGTANLTARLNLSCIGLGTKTLSVSPDSKFISAGLFDSDIELFSTLTYNKVIKLEHPTKIDLNDKSANLKLYVY
jgi:hypothetical protein